MVDLPGLGYQVECGDMMMLLAESRISVKIHGGGGTGTEGTGTVYTRYLYVEIEINSFKHDTCVCYLVTPSTRLVKR